MSPSSYFLSSFLSLAFLAELNCTFSFGNESQDGYIASKFLNFKDCTITRQCACATGNVHVRSGAGSSHGVLGTLTPGDCYTYKREQTHVGNLDWAHINYNGQEGWVAASWLTIGACTGGNQQLPGCPDIVSRSTWGARSPKTTIADLPSTPQNVYIHHGGSESCHSQSECETILHSWQNYHMDQHGWADLGYSFVVGEDGHVYEGRGWGKVGSHTANHDTDGLGISIIGDFARAAPSSAATDAVKKLIKCGVDNGKISSNYIVYGHRDVNPATSCPGDKLYQLVQTWPHYKSSQ